MSESGLTDSSLQNVQQILNRYPLPPIPRKRIPYRKDRHLSLGECAKELGCSREKVRKIEIDALEKCRRWLQQNGLLDL